MVNIGSGCVVDWLSVTQLSKTLKIPETTTRRYLNSFEEYFRWEQIGRGKKYHPDSIEILQRIAMLYSLDRDTAEIKRILSDEYAFTIENGENTIHPPAYDISGKLDEFQQRQDDFNKQLLKQLNEQQRYIAELIESRNKDMEQTKQLFSPEEKKAERFDQIMAEYKVKRELEKRALSLWLEKPTEERLKKVSWFRKEEDGNKRDVFIKDYINLHFEEFLKKELNI